MSKFVAIVYGVFVVACCVILVGSGVAQVRRAVAEQKAKDESRPGQYIVVQNDVAVKLELLVLSQNENSVVVISNRTGGPIRLDRNVYESLVIKPKATNAK